MAAAAPSLPWVPDSPSKPAQLQRLLESLSAEYPIQLTYDDRPGFPRTKESACRNIIRFLFYTQYSELERTLDEFRRAKTKDVDQLHAILRTRGKYVLEYSPKSPKHRRFLPRANVQPIPIDFNRPLTSLVTSFNFSEVSAGVSPISTPQDASQCSSSSQSSIDEVDLGRIAEPPVDVHLEDYRLRDLPSQGLFGSDVPAQTVNLPLRVRYEVTRFALHYNIPVPDLSMMNPSDLEEYDKLLGHLQKSTCNISRHHTFEPCSLSTWSVFANSGDESTIVPMTADLRLAPKRSSTLFTLRLGQPVVSVQSNRFFRKFGVDRFLKLRIPRFSDYPRIFNRALLNARFQEWFLRAEKRLLGCSWAVFYVKNKNTTKKKSEKFKEEDGYEVMLFATSGPGLRNIGLAEVLNWFMPLGLNQDLPTCKGYARIELGFSTTWATFAFKPSQIRAREDDIRGDDTPEDVSLIDPAFYSDAWNAVYHPGKPRVMNDGCARLSYGAALEIWKFLKEESPLPSAFQARLGPWKGIWMVESSFPNTNDIWIEVTPSQQKFNPHQEDSSDEKCDPLRLTFEVICWSTEISPSTMFPDYVPILEERGVPRRALEAVVVRWTASEEEQAKQAFSSSIHCLKWIQSRGLVSEDVNTGFSWHGPRRKDATAKIKSLVDSGFDITKNKMLVELTLREMAARLTRKGNDLRVGISKSTYVLGVADPVGCLGPSEIHFGFSNSELTGTPFLQGTDVLVSRHPALRASDIQRVHAVFKPELMHLRNVVVFPTSGSFPLAQKLQGGDYDGDRFWVCWEPELVKPFRNAPPPATSPNPELYGIDVDRSRIGHFYQDADDLLEFLGHNFAFQGQENLLGRVTNYHEARRYMAHSEQGTKAQKVLSAVADIHDLLVDSAKNGYSYTGEMWATQLSTWGQPKQIPPPMYKTTSEYQLEDQSVKCLARGMHINDYLIFKVVRQEIRDLLERLKPAWAKNDAIEDHDVSGLYRQKREEFRGDIELTAMLDDLVSQLGKEALFRVRYNRTWAATREKSNRNSQEHEQLWASAAAEAYDVYANILPLHPDDPRVKDWLTPSAAYAPSAWSLLKASCLYSLDYARPNLAFIIAGDEICYLKAHARRGTESIVCGIRGNLQVKKRGLGSFVDSDDLKSPHKRQARA